MHACSTSDQSLLLRMMTTVPALAHIPTSISGHKNNPAVPVNRISLSRNIAAARIARRTTGILCTSLPLSTQGLVAASLDHQLQYLVARMTEWMFDLNSSFVGMFVIFSDETFHSNCNRLLQALTTAHSASPIHVAFRFANLAKLVYDADITSWPETKRTICEFINRNSPR